MRTVIVGDIHGCMETLRTLLEEVSLTSSDDLILLGDLVDRGPSSVEVVRYLHDLSKTMKITLIRGNHEHKHIITWSFGAKLSNRDEIMAIQESLTPEERDWMFSGSLFHRDRERDFICVHGGIPSSMSKLPWPTFDDNRGKKASTEAKSLMFLRREGEKPWAEGYDGRFGFAFFGHSVFPTPMNFPHALGLDTGAGYGGHLSAVVLEGTTQTIVSIPTVENLHADQTN